MALADGLRGEEERLLGHGCLGWGVEMVFSFLEAMRRRQEKEKEKKRRNHPISFLFFSFFPMFSQRGLLNPGGIQVLSLSHSHSHRQTDRPTDRQTRDAQDREQKQRRFSFSSSSSSSLSKGLEELGDDLLELGVGLLSDLLLGPDVLEHVSVVLGDVGEELLLELEDLGDLKLVEEAADTAVDDGDLVLGGEGAVLALLEQLGEAGTAVQEELSGGVEVRAELGEGGNLTVLGELQLEGGGDLLHGLGLGGGADTGHGETDVDGGADTLEEEIGLEEDLAVGDGNDVGGNVGGHITSLGLDDGEGGHGASAVLVGELGGALQETGVEVENVSGVGLTTGGTTQQQGHLTVGDSLLGEIVVDDEGVLAVVTEVLSHGGTGVGGEELKGGGLGGGGGHDDGVLHGVVGLEGLDELGDGGPLLANGDVDTVQLLLRVVGVVPLPLVEDGVDGDGGLAGLTIANDELTLATTDGDHGVDGLETSLHGLVHRLAGNDTGGLHLDTGAALGGDGTLGVNGVAEGVHDTAEKLITDGHVDDGTGPLDDITLLDQGVGTEDDNTDVVGLEVEGHTLHTKRRRKKG